MEELKKRIENKGLKQRWIAKQLDISFEVLNRWLNKKADMPEERKIQIEKLIN